VGAAAPLGLTCLELAPEARFFSGLVLEAANTSGALQLGQQPGALGPPPGRTAANLLISITCDHHFCHLEANLDSGVSGSTLLVMAARNDGL